MLLIKRMSAWDFLCDINDEVYHKDVGELYEDIVDREMFDALDNVISYKFPNGVEEDELTEFFINEQDYIRKQLGIEKDND